MCFLFTKKRRIQIICSLMQCLCCLCFWAAIWKKCLPVKGNKICKSVQNVVPRSVSHLFRPLCVGVMGVLGSSGRTVPFLEQFLPCRTETFAQPSQSKRYLLHHLRAGTAHKCLRLCPNWHGITGQETTTRGVLCLKECKQIYLEIKSNS